MTSDATPRRKRGRPKRPIEESSTGTVQTLERGIKLLQALSEQDQCNLTNLALSVGMPPSTALRLLTTLKKHRFVDQDASSQDWSIGIEAFTIGCAYLSRTNVIEASREVMRELMNESGETTNLAIEDDGDIVFIAQVETHNPIRAFHSPGTRGHMHASGIGKALLASLSRQEVEKILAKKGLPGFTERTLCSTDELFNDLRAIKERGWSLDDEERFLGMRCVAVSIYDMNGRAVAGISISGPTIRFQDGMVAQLGAKVADAASRVTTLVGGKTPV